MSTYKILNMKAIITICIFFLGLISLSSLLGLGVLSGTIFIFTTILIFQGLLALYSMLHSWIAPSDNQVTPESEEEKLSFSLLIPARFEKDVIADTIRAMTKIDYPQQKLEVIVIIRRDDIETIIEAQRAIYELDASNVRLTTFEGGPINKARGLNEGLKTAKNEIIGIFDAEDEPSTSILRRVNNAFASKKVDVIQATVQPITLDSSWYSAFSCLEYFFWYKSVLPLFSKLGATPLGGNTVFFKKRILEQAEGWNEKALTEDAEIGIRLSASGYRIYSIYDEKIATLEETPVNIGEFIRQRVRWNQGFLQVLLKRDWMKLPTIQQQLMAVYILLQPVIHHFAIFGFFIMPIAVAGFKVPVWLAIYSFIPLYLLSLELGISMLGLHELAKLYNQRLYRRQYFGIFMSYISYQLVLVIASTRAFIRLILGNSTWEKTSHMNTHRVDLLNNIYAYEN